MSSPQTNVVGQRTAAWILDVIPSIVLFVIGIRVFGTEGPVSIFDDESSGLRANLSLGDTEYTAAGTDALKVYALVVAWGLLNSVVLQGTTGASVGKHLLGLRVVRPDGQVCGIGKAAVRWLLLVVDAFPYCAPLVGFVVALSSKGNQRVGDMLAGTYVVRKRDAGRPVEIGAPQQGYPGGGYPAQGYPQQGYAQPQPQSQPQTQPMQKQPSAPAGEPQWDDARKAWIRWDGHQWLQHDTAANAWGPIR